jgi:hypothetical protein
LIKRLFAGCPVEIKKLTNAADNEPVTTVDQVEKLFSKSVTPPDLHPLPKFNYELLRDNFFLEMVIKQQR